MLRRARAVLSQHQRRNALGQCIFDVTERPAVSVHIEKTGRDDRSLGGYFSSASDARIHITHVHDAIFANDDIGAFSFVSKTIDDQTSANHHVKMFVRIERRRWRGRRR